MDSLTPAARSANMSKIRGSNTAPEVRVRKLLFAMGYRFRLHDKSLVGRPDIVFNAKRVAIFVHGCFWHRHDCGLAYSPKSRSGFWQTKFDKNVARDSYVQQALKDQGWKVAVVWECELKEPKFVVLKLKKLLGRPRSTKRKALFSRRKIAR